MLSSKQPDAHSHTLVIEAEMCRLALPGRLFVFIRAYFIRAYFIRAYVFIRAYCIPGQIFRLALQARSTPFGSMLVCGDACT